MYHINFKNTLCSVTYFLSHVNRLHVDFKKWLYCCVEFRGHDPYPVHNEDTLNAFFSSLRRR